MVHTFLWVVAGHCLHAGIIESHNFLAYVVSISHSNSANREISIDVSVVELCRREVALHTSSHLTWRGGGGGGVEGVGRRGGGGRGGGEDLRTREETNEDGKTQRKKKRKSRTERRDIRRKSAEERVKEHKKRTNRLQEKN